MSVQHLGYYDEKELSEALVGRRIVSAEKGSFREQDAYRSAEGLLVLDDGTVLLLAGNDGGCSCGGGDYDLTHVAEVDNVITGVQVELPPESDYGDRSGTYTIFVFAENEKISVAEFDGDDGSGYYGTGFSVTVIRPDVLA